MAVKIGAFEMTYRSGGLYLRVPFVGAAYIGNGMTCWDRWAAIR